MLPFQLEILNFMLNVSQLTCNELPCESSLPEICKEKKYFKFD